MSDIAALYRPSKCERRVYLQTTSIKPSEASAYDECLRKMGIAHEQKHLATLGNYFDYRYSGREICYNIERDEGCGKVFY